MPDEVFLARHGQTEWNLEDRRQGLHDSPLTATGRRQNRRNAALLCGLDIDVVVSSPLGRALETAETLSVALGLRVIVLPTLHEIDHGRMTGLTDAEIVERFPAEAAHRAADRYRYRFPCGESYLDAETRARQVLGWLTGAGYRRPLLVSHEMIGRTLVGLLLGLAPHEMLAGSHPHHVIYRIHRRTGCAGRPATVAPDGVDAVLCCADPLVRAWRTCLDREAST